MAAPGSPGRSLLRFHPADLTLIALLALAVGVAGARLRAVDPPLGGPLGLHLGLLLGFTACAWAMARWEEAPAVWFVRPLLIVNVIFILYTSLGKLGVAAFAPHLADAGLARLDRWLCGTDPSLFLQRYQTPARVEFFSFAYGAFIPYIYVSLFLGCLGRPPLERDQFLTGWVFTYAVSYLGYLFVPAHGPLVYHEPDYHVHLQGGFFYQAVVKGVEASGGLQGVFPSLHVGGSVYLCLFDLKTHRLRGLTYLPLVLLIYLATLFLRYHYVVDLIAGTALAAGCIPLGRAALGYWAGRREAAGLPALPGGEGDALSAVPGAGPADAAPLLSAH